MRKPKHTCTHTNTHAQLMLIKYLGKSLAYVRIIKRIDVNGFSTCKLFPICLRVLWSSFESCQVFCCIKYNLHSGSWEKKNELGSRFFFRNFLDKHAESN